MPVGIAATEEGLVVYRSSVTADQETEKIKVRAQTAEAQNPHKFRAAQWTHPNGHPRCHICGCEERIGGMCPGLKAEPVQFGPGAAGSKKGEEVGFVATEDGIQVYKYNPFHDKGGRFTTGTGTGSRVNISDPRAMAAAARQAERLGLKESPGVPVKAGKPFEAKTAGGAQTFITGHEASKILSDAQQASLDNYQGLGYSAMNKALRGDKVPGKATGAHIANLDAAFASSGAALGRPVTVYRGLDGKQGNALVARLKGNPKGLNGMTLTDKGFMSTSLLAGTAETFGGLRIAITLGKGQKALMTNFGPHTKEKEAVLPRNTSLVVTGSRQVGGTTFVTARLIS